MLEGQLGRSPRDPWRVGVRCGYGYPSVIVTPPLLDGGEPFPTLFYLTCPWLVDEVSRLESAGGISGWAERIAGEPELAARMRASDTRYREMRAQEGGGEDPCSDMGIAGQADPLATKCLHAHVAAYLGGTSDPVGEATLAVVETECQNERCAPYAEVPDDA